MRFTKYALALAAGCALTLAAFGAQQTVNTTTGSADTLQAGGNKINANFTELYTTLQPALSGDVTTTGASNATTIAAGAVSLAKQANLASNSIIGNNTGSATVPVALSPLQASNLLGSTISVRAVLVSASCAVPTTGTASAVDGVTLAVGQNVLIVASAPDTASGANSTGTAGSSANCGIYAVTSGTWTRALNFVGTVAQNCDLAVFVREGWTYAGHTFRLDTSSAITIGTTAQPWYDGTVAALGKNSNGTVGHGSTVGMVGHLSDDQSWNGTAGTGVIAQFASVDASHNWGYDCLSVGASGGVDADIMDAGNWVGTSGPCVVSDQSGHPLTNNTGSPSFAGTGGSGGALAAYSTDSRGTVTGLVSRTAVTITFSATYGASATLTATANPNTIHPGPPACVASASVSGVNPYTSAVSATAVTFTMTANAGPWILYYICL